MMTTMKTLALAALALGLASCKCPNPAAKAMAPMAYKLDAAHSQLSAVAIKNEVKPVALKFPDLEGGLDAKPFKALLSARLDTLDTGDKGRDANVRNFFFEIAKTGNDRAMIEVTEIGADLDVLKDGASLATTAKGKLSMHGSSLEISGPLQISRKGSTLSVSFKDAWTINIKSMGMLDALANLNKNCPQPHRVGLDVKLSGELVFQKL